MNLIALLLEMLFGRRMRLQPVPVRPTRRDQAPSSIAELERDSCRSDACWLLGMGLTGSNPSVYSSDIETLHMRRFDTYPAHARRSWTG